MFDTLFSHFDANAVLDILSHLMTSRSSILIVSKRIDLLTPIAEAILALLFPLRLVEHVYIPVLPPSAQHARYLRSPIPLFAGIHTSALDLVFSADHSATPNIVICHADTGKVIPPIVNDGSKIATIPGFIRRVAARDIQRHVHLVKEGHVTVDAPRVRTSTLRMFCALIDGFTPRVLSLSIEEDLEEAWIVGGSKSEDRVFQEVKNEEFYRQLFESSMWISFVHEYLYESTQREAQLDVFDRYRSIWTSPEETRGEDISRVLFPWGRERSSKSEEDDEPIRISLSEIVEKELGDICRRVLGNAAVCEDGEEEKVEDESLKEEEKHEENKKHEEKNIVMKANRVEAAEEIKEEDLSALEKIRRKLALAKLRVEQEKAKLNQVVLSRSPVRDNRNRVVSFALPEGSFGNEEDDSYGGCDSMSSGGFSSSEEEKTEERNYQKTMTM